MALPPIHGVGRCSRVPLQFDNILNGLMGAKGSHQSIKNMRTKMKREVFYMSDSLNAHAEIAAALYCASSAFNSMMSFVAYRLV